MSANNDSTITAIEQAHATGMIRNDMRATHDRKLWAMEVRFLLSWLSIKGVSVTAPSYSQAQSIDITLPTPEHEHTGEYISDCPTCARRWAARVKLEQLILAAFPDLGDCSDSRTDHFDYCLSFN